MKDEESEALALVVEYTNARGETSQRRILPLSVWHGSTLEHPEPQWLVRALDLDEQEFRDFSWSGFRR